MIIHREYQQRSIPWMLAHIGIPTASGFGNLLTKKLAVSTGDMVDTYLDKKIAERWLDDPLPDFRATAEMEQGNVLEEEVFNWYEFNFDEKIERVGFCTSDDGRYGCSPDGLINIAPDGKSCEGGLEVKSPQAHIHAGYIRNGGVPAKYLAQVHGNMLVTGAKWWKFISYRRLFPRLIVTVWRDEEVLDQLAEALALFLAKFDIGIRQLEQLNGGPSTNVGKLREVAEAQLREPPKFSWEQEQEEKIDLTP